MSSVFLTTDLYGYVPQGDDPTVLAKNFCRTHGLGSSSEAKLAQMFADQIAGVEDSSLYAAS